ncbi:MAG: cupin domain-containing protein [Rhodospirillales bacterium]|nr:MAG: cupin domain-containing protein [Rhodospirillales bacterium]
MHHHPSDELLLDYASGALGEGWSLAIATHLALCPACRRAVAGMETLGGGFLTSVAPAPIGDDALDIVMARLDAEPQEPAAAPVAEIPRGAEPVLPQPLRGYLGGDAGDLEWRRLGLGAFQVPVAMEDRRTSVRLLRIPAGRPVPEHSHRGLELTLVLRGAFSDATGEYKRGDFQEADDSLEHRPHAAPGEDCICLAVTDAPLRFSSVTARIVQPLLGI